VLLTLLSVDIVAVIWDTVNLCHVYSLLVTQAVEAWGQRVNQPLPFQLKVKKCCLTSLLSCIN